jgi:glycosyltransferase involved in cell wall biosynthesis
MDISLIICAHNEEECIGPCIESVLKNAAGKFKEIIVVDNASNDKTAEIAAGLGIRVVREAQKGLTHARQAGMHGSTSAYLAYIDADSIVPPAWYEKAEALFAKYPDAVSISGPRRYFGVVWYKIWILNGFWAIAPLTYRLVGYMILGGNFVVKREALEKIGGFDREIAFYGEDTNLAKRLSKVGKTVFRMDFYLYSSARRFEKEGVWRANMVYFFNYLWPVLFNRPFTKDYQDVR